jgi:hypothetical protein
MTYEMTVEALKEFRALYKQKALSDEYLEASGRTTRERIGVGGEFSYGIAMMPDELVLDIAAAIYRRYANDTELPWDDGD